MNAPDAAALPLFPLQAVLYPGGLLGLKVFEPRYLDLMGRCLRESSPFGVVALRQGGEVRRPGEAVELEACGVLAQVDEVDSPQPGILQVRCHGTQRFRIDESRQQDDGLWVAQVAFIDDDEALAPSEALIGSVRGLASAIDNLAQQGTSPFLEPFRFDDAGWVANRWCEILPISLAAKQKLMELDDPMMRLQIVDEFLRTKGVID
jgi:Lon protease-like protein